MKKLENKNLPLTSIDEIGLRWIRRKYVTVTWKSEELTIENKTNFSYSNIMARKQPFTSICHKNEKVKDAFTNFFVELEKIKVFKNGEEPSVKGRKFTHPRYNILSGAPKKKRKYSCSICKSHNHTKTKHKRNEI